MKKVDIAKAHGVQPIVITRMIRGDRFTIRRRLALDVAKFTGKAPIDFIHPDKRKDFLSDFPDMKKKLKKIDS